MLDVVGRQAVKFTGVSNLNLLLIIRDVAVKRGLFLGEIVVELFEPRAGGIVLVNAGKAELQQVAGQVVASRRIGLCELERRERLVDIAIQAERSLGGTGFADHLLGVVAESGIGMDLLHQTGKVGGAIDVADGVVEWDQGICDGAGGLDRGQLGEGGVGGCQMAGDGLFETGDVRFRRPYGRLDLGLGKSDGGKRYSYEYLGYAGVEHREPR